ncbi:MAG: alkaline phosphatase family protein [Clostridium sp.]|jgi:predicted AlkP superfamily pyrophosphatase or phosphodiesterase|nr:alkaline phosphatase family protein [Clostridium sp.]
MRVVVVSFDAVSDTNFMQMASIYPNIRRYADHSTLTLGVSTVFLSNTYPVHTSIATGVLPSQHGIRSNIEQGLWVCDSRRIQTPTLWDKVKAKRLTCGAVLWPVTGYAQIKYNVPEMHIRPGQNQLFENLRAGSFFFQLKVFIRHRKRLHGIIQPYLDDFVTTIVTDLIRKRSVDLTLIHLTAYDDDVHRHGVEGAEYRDGAKSLDQNLGRILDATTKDDVVIVFSDHAQFSVQETIDLNKRFALSERHDLSYNLKGYFDLCGGSAFYLGKDELSPALRDEIASKPWFERFLTTAEIQDAGYARDCALGIAARIGFRFGDEQLSERADHGYPLDYPDYKVFYGINDSPNKPVQRNGGHVFDITAMIESILELNEL